MPQNRSSHNEEQRENLVAAAPQPEDRSAEANAAAPARTDSSDAARSTRQPEQYNSVHEDLIRRQFQRISELEQMNENYRRFLRSWLRYRELMRQRETELNHYRNVRHWLRQTSMMLREHISRMDSMLRNRFRNELPELSDDVSDIELELTLPPPPPPRHPRIEPVRDQQPGPSERAFSRRRRRQQVPPNDGRNEPPEREREQTPGELRERLGGAVEDGPAIRLTAEGGFRPQSDGE